MIKLTQTNSENPDFQNLVKELDADLKIRDGDDHVFYAQLNKTDTIKHVVVAYENNEAIGCGAVRTYSEDTMEVKRMFVSPNKRGQGIASRILAALENQCSELGFKKCILETGIHQPEALRLYEKNGYKRIPNFGKYEGVKNSVCFEKELK